MQNFGVTNKEHYVFLLSGVVNFTFLHSELDIIVHYHNPLKLKFEPWISLNHNTYCSNLLLLFFQFEWAWQNPTKSRRLRHVFNKKTKESCVAYRFRVLSAMLNVGPWNRLPLTIRWLKQEYQMEFDVEQQPPTHMPIVYGLLNKKKPKKRNQEECEESKDVCNYKCIECSKRIKVQTVFLKQQYFFVSFEAGEKQLGRERS